MAPPPGNPPPLAPLTSHPAARGTCLNVGHPSMAVWPGLWGTPGPQASNSDLLQLPEPGPGIFSPSPTALRPLLQSCVTWLLRPLMPGYSGCTCSLPVLGCPCCPGSFSEFLLSYPSVRPIGEKSSNYQKVCLHCEACFHQVENSLLKRNAFCGLGDVTPCLSLGFRSLPVVCTVIQLGFMET